MIMGQMRNTPSYEKTRDSKPWLGQRNSLQAKGERNLWASVLYLMVHDLSEAGSYTDRQAAEQWVGKYPTRDFREVCHLAGVEPDAVWHRLHKLCQQPPKERKWRRDWYSRGTSDPSSYQGEAL